MILKNKVALVTGCNRGIGRAILEKFAQNGAILYANSRKEGSIDELSVELSSKYNTEVIPMYFDVTDNKAVKECFMRINKERKQIDILVSNAGIMQDALIGMIDDKVMEKTFSTNVFAVINLIQYAVKLMGRKKSGSIINMASIVAVQGNAGQAVYSASKGAIISLTKTASKELSGKGIRVNAIAPGVIDTDMVRTIGEERVKDSVSKIGFGRLGNPSEVADMALFLASDMSSYVTGQIIGVDGGAII